jgi:hypothetical protein
MAKAPFELILTEYIIKTIREGPPPSYVESGAEKDLFLEKVAGILRQ